ncbi:MAG: sugar-binding protein [Nibricoccus sp.]
MKVMTAACAWLGLMVFLAASARAETFPIPRIPNVTIDGRNSDWKDAGARVGVLSRLSHVGIENDPTGRTDLRLGWDDQGLLILIRVQDETRVESGDDSLYRGDSVEVFLAPSVGSKDFLQVVASPGIPDSETPKVRSTVVVHGDLLKAKQAAEVAGGSDAKGWWLELRLGWSGLGIAP